ncbi:MAG: hypothetical protein LC798_20710, partial [Chloroflexi bacterium]|nr:hypothetical protein [Chloroflexota bacterium]
MAGKHGCTGTTRKGEPCGAWPLKDRDVCLAHSDLETRASVRFGGVQPGGGRPKNPRAVDVLRERIEQNIDRWLAPIEEALAAERGIVVGMGEDASLEFIPDHAIRLRAAAEGFDRVYGKPKQAIEQSGPEGGPIQVEGVD